jgi:hypothetical protein
MRTKFEYDVVWAGLNAKITPGAGLQKFCFGQGKRWADPANGNISMFDSSDFDDGLRCFANPEAQEIPPFQDGVSLS